MTDPASAGSGGGRDSGAPVPRAGVAVVGVGRMGAAMAARVRGAGHRVTLYNRSRGRAERVASTIGATVSGSPREAAAGAGVVVVSLADDAAVRHVYGGPDGLTAGLAAGAVVAETSTVHPDTVRDLLDGVRSRGADLLDSPVSGSVSLVERGELTALVGGDPSALERARPVLAAFASRVFHLGASGAGATVKLAVNSVIHALNLAVAEALVMAEKAGVPRDSVYEVFANSAAAAPFVLYKRAAFVHPEDTPVAFALDLVAKDLSLIDALATRVGARMDQLTTTRHVVNRAVENGHGPQDMSALAALLRTTPRP